MVFALCAAPRRPEDDPAWDRDPLQWAKNRRFEKRLNHIIDPYGADDPDPPNGGFDVHGIVAGFLKFGLYPGLFAWLIFMGATQFSESQKENNKTQHLINQALQQHMHESRVTDTRLERMQEVMLGVLEAMCVNQAVGREEQNRCMGPRRGGNQ